MGGACFPHGLQVFAQGNHELGQSTAVSGMCGTGIRKQRARNRLGVRYSLGEHTPSSPKPHVWNFPEPLKTEPLTED